MYDTPMGFYYGPSSQDPQPEEKPPGCLDALLITRAVFGVLMWPVIAMIAVVADIVIIIWAFSVHPALALVPVAATAAGVAAFARWEQGRFRPPEL
jgi:hypothetical protein